MKNQNEGQSYGRIEGPETWTAIIVSTILSAVSVGVSLLIASLNKPRTPRTPFDDRPTTLSQRGAILPHLFGRRRMGYLFLWAGDRKQIQAKGASKYREAGWHGICCGPCDALHAIYQGGKPIWQKKITPADTPSGSVLTCPNNEGHFSIFWGECGQPINTTLAQVKTNRKGLPAYPGVASRWPGMCYIFWHNKNLGFSPVWPQLSYEFERRGASDTVTLIDSDAWMEETTPANPVTGTTVWFDGGAAIAAGTYDLTYIEGAMKYRNADDAQWKIHRDAKYGWRIVDINGKVKAKCPGRTVGYTSQAECEAANAGATTSFVWPGGVMGLKLVDLLYRDNVAGGPNPTFEVDGPGGTFSTPGVVNNNVSAVGSADDGMNPAHVLWQLLTGAYPYGLAIPVDRLDVAAFEAVGAALEAERLPVNFSTEGYQDVRQILNDLLTDIGMVLPQGGGKITPRLIRASDPGTVPTITADLNADPKPKREQLQGGLMPDRTTFYIKDRRRNYRSNDDIAGGDHDQEALENARVRSVQVEIKTVTDGVTGAKVAGRRALEMSVETNKLQIQAARETTLLVPGQAFILAGESQYRVASIQKGLLNANTRINAVLDQYGLDADSGSTTDTPPEGFGFDGIDNLSVAMQLPADLRPVAGIEYMLILRVRESEAIDRANVLFSADDTNFVDIGDADYCTGGYLNSPIEAATDPVENVSITVEGPDIDQVIDLTGRDDEYNAGRQLTYIEGEWFLLRKITAVSGGWRLDGLTRAQFGSAAALHDRNAPVFICIREKFNLYTSPLLTTGATRYVKLQPKDALGNELVDADSIPSLSFTLT